jgi:diguanylate cyclase (GGDEF)-like protein
MMPSRGQLLKEMWIWMHVALKEKICKKEVEEERERGYTDGLTGLYNQTYAARRVKEEIYLSQREKKLFHLIELDIDKFKDYNDTYGQIAGNELLKDVSIIMLDNIRLTDTLSRFGGDEFLLLMHGVDKEHAERVAKRLVKDVEGYSNEISLSYGISTYKPRGTFNERDVDAYVKTLIHTADRRMKEQKKAKNVER